MANKPKVSIGLPVYNGERYLQQALDSLLAQTFKDFEIVICDNASIDGTEAICREYSAQDHRIRYHRNEVNLGAAPNFNLTFKLSRGDYFKWAAHDDFCSPEFISRCVDTLERDNTAILVWSKVIIVDENGQPITSYSFDRPLDSPNLYTRFESLLYDNPCYMVFGLIRRNAILKTREIMGSYNHGDGVFLERLSLQGRFIQIPDYLLFSRRHTEQSMTMVKTRKEYSIWFDVRNKDRLVLPWGKATLERFKSLHMYSMTMKERIECYRRLYWNVRGLCPLLFAELKYGLRALLTQ